MSSRSNTYLYQPLESPVSPVPLFAFVRTEGYVRACRLQRSLMPVPETATSGGHPVARWSPFFVPRIQCRFLRIHGLSVSHTFSTAWFVPSQITSNTTPLLRAPVHQVDKTTTAHQTQTACPEMAIPANPAPGRISSRCGAKRPMDVGSLSYTRDR